MKKYKVVLSHVFTASLILFVTFISLSGCISTLKGDYYLSSKDYDSGITAFENQIKEKPDEASNHYYLGRFYIAKKQHLKANQYLKTAVSLNPGNDDYRFWLGLSYGGLKDDAMEMKNYQKAIELNPKNVKAHIYLGHMFFKLKTYLQALESYENALSFQSAIPSALYNKALILNKLNRAPEAKIAFKDYLKRYSKSTKAIRVTGYLNRMGDFEYRSHLIHRKKMVLKQIEFDSKGLNLTHESKESLVTIGARLKADTQLILYVLSYQKNNRSIAKQKAKKIKEYLANQITGLNLTQIKLSWFPESERIQIGKKTYTLDKSINLFAISK